MNLDAVRHACESVAGPVAAAIAAQEDVLVLGGDCTVELGTVAGANAAGARIGLVYIDFDADLNTPDTSDGALDWTGVAHLLNIPGCEPSLAGLGPTRPMLVPQQLLYFGVENITAPEAAAIRDYAIKVISREEALSDIEAAAARAAEWATRFDCVLIHFDVDVLSFIDFPIAENVFREIEGRAADHLEHVGGRGLLLQVFSRSSPSNRVFSIAITAWAAKFGHQLDLLVGEGTLTSWR